VKQSEVNIAFMPSKTRGLFLKLSDLKSIKKYILVGGTALSLQLGHRFSEDLDFIFDGDSLPLSSIKSNIGKRFSQSKIIRQDDGHQIDFVIDGVKLTFFTTASVMVYFNLKENVIPYNNMQIASYKIIASLKLAAIAQRNTIRDYYDLYYITKNFIPLQEIFKQTKKLLPNISPITYTETLVFTADIEEVQLSEHLSPKENITKEEIAAFFKQELIKILH
jgi:predicted nucleotidyltransferase component of viral defense system